MLLSKRLENEDSPRPRLLPPLVRTSRHRTENEDIRSVIARIRPKISITKFNVPPAAIKAEAKKKQKNKQKKTQRVTFPLCLITVIILFGHN